MTLEVELFVDESGQELTIRCGEYEISMDRFTDLKQIYTNPSAGVKVSKATLRDSGLFVAIKEQVSPSLKQANSAIRESLNQAKLDHPNVCKIYECYIDTTFRPGFKSVIVMEWMEHDMFYVIRERQHGQKQFWTEEELWGYLVALIEALAFAQSKGISHRDIKPQNIFLNSQNEIKLGDFGASKWMVSDVNQQSIQGTPFFLSPILRDMYKHFVATGDTQVTHNQYKSDVYSLGLTLLFMADLAEPKELMDLRTLEANTTRKLAQVRYSSRIKAVLERMLTISEAERPDFLELLKLLNRRIRSSLDGFRVSMADQGEQDASMKSAMQEDGSGSTPTEEIIFGPTKEVLSVPSQGICPYCRQKLSIQGEAWVCSSKNCPFPRTPIQPGRIICSICSREFQPANETWRSNLGQTHKKDVSEFNTICSPHCADEFLKSQSRNPSLTCVCCRVSLENGQIGIRLNCDPTHQFCSRECILSYVMRCSCNYRLQTVLRCPVCIEPFEYNLVINAYGDVQALNEAVGRYRVSHCEHCSQEEASYRLPCGTHYLCSRCKDEETYAECQYCGVRAPIVR